MKFLEKFCEKVVRNFDYTKMIHNFEDVGMYVITGMQFPNVPVRRVGYVVQVRKKAGAFGTDIVFIRHPDGCLVTHENQVFYMMNEEDVKELKEFYPQDCGPEYEDHTKEYSIGGKFPMAGKIVHPNGKQETGAKSHPVRITVESDNRTEEIIIVE
jgi:hypothetical protein